MKKLTKKPISNIKEQIKQFNKNRKIDNKKFYKKLQQIKPRYKNNKLKIILEKYETLSKKDKINEKIETLHCGKRNTQCKYNNLYYH